MRKFKLFAFVGIIIISYVIGGIMGFALCASTPSANANPAPAVTNVQNTQNTQSNVYTQTMYVDGQRYVVFTSSASSMFVIRK